MLPVRSIAAKLAKKVFFEHVNEIDIYIEDTTVGFEKVYLKIFSRVFIEKYKIRKIFPLGGRKSVIDNHMENKGFFSKPTLSVIDGDAYLLAGDEHVNQAGLYIFPFYCIENIFLDKVALIKVGEEEDVLKTEGEMESAIDFPGWIDRNILLLNLFIEYALCMKLTPTVQSVSYPLTKLTRSNLGEIDTTKVNNRIEEVRNAIISAVGENVYLENKEALYSQVRFNSDDFLKYISGKDHLFPLMYARLRTLTKSKASKINIQQRLAKICDISHLNDAHEFVLECK